MSEFDEASDPSTGLQPEKWIMEHMYRRNLAHNALQNPWIHVRAVLSSLANTRVFLKPLLGPAPRAKAQLAGHLVKSTTSRCLDMLDVVK